jgi:hypothetical protein
MRILPTFRGWTVDARLKEFRRTGPNGMEYLSFNTDEGDDLLSEYIAQLVISSREFQEVNP